MKTNPFFLNKWVIIFLDFNIILVFVISNLFNFSLYIFNGLILVHLFLKILNLIPAILILKKAICYLLPFLL